MLAAMCSMRKRCSQAHETILAEFGAVDILINAAGGNHPSATTSDQRLFLICLRMRCDMLAI